MPERIRNAGEWMPPSGQDDLARAELFLLAADLRGHAGDAAAVEHERRRGARR